MKRRELGVESQQLIVKSSDPSGFYPQAKIEYLRCDSYRVAPQRHGSRFTSHESRFCIRVHQCASVVSIPEVPLLAANEVGARFAAADHAEAAACDEHFGGARPGIVVRCLDETVRPGSPQHEHIA